MCTPKIKGYRNFECRTRIFFVRICALVLVFILLFPIPTQADSISSESAGAAEARFRENEIAFDPGRDRDPSEKSAIDDKTDKKESKKQGDGELPVFRMNDIRIVGNESIPTSELEKYVWTLLNRDVNMDEIQEVVSNIKEHYRKSGFISTYVHIPPQQIQNGIVELRIVEGQLADIQISGNRFFSEKIILKNFTLIDTAKVDYEELRKSLKRINRHRDIEAKAVLSPGAKPGTTSLDIQVKDKFPAHLIAYVNNLGTRNTGKTRWGVQAMLTNLTGHMDELSGRFQIGKGSTAVGANYEIPIPSINARAGLSFTRATVDVGGRFKALNLKGDATTYGAYLLKKILDTKHFEGDVKAGFDWKSVENKILGQTSSKDEHRILKFGLLLNEMDKYGKTFTDQSVHFGFDRFLGASHKRDPRSTRLGAGGQFFIYRANIQRYFILPHDTLLAFKFGMQLTEDALAPSEQFKLGGTFSVRGFPESEYLGDQGATLTTELMVPTFFIPKSWKLPWSEEPLQKQIQMVGFFDFGGASLRRPLPGEKESRFLAGIGGGVRVRLYEKIYARAEWGTSVGAGPINHESSVFYFGVQAELF